MADFDDSQIINKLRVFFKEHPLGMYSEQEIADKIKLNVPAVRLVLTHLTILGEIKTNGCKPLRYFIKEPPVNSSVLKREEYKPAPEPFRRNNGYPSPESRVLMLSKAKGFY